MLSCDVPLIGLTCDNTCFWPNCGVLLAQQKLGSYLSLPIYIFLSCSYLKVVPYKSINVLSLHNQVTDMNNFISEAVSHNP